MTDTPPLPPDAAPDVLAELDLARRRFELLERRISSWERRLARLEEALGVDGPDPGVLLAGFEELEVRTSRLERKRFEMLAARRRDLGDDIGLDAEDGPPSGPPIELGEARALVFPEWHPPVVDSGAEVVLEVMVDGFAPDETVRFTVVEPARPDAPPVVLEAPAGEGDRVQVRWVTPGPGKREKTRSFVFRAACGGIETESSVLKVG